MTQRQGYALFTGAFVYVFLCTIFTACTTQDRAAIVKTVSDLAGEVCVEGDTVGVCLKKCEAEHQEREAAGHQPE